jgi:hypothetical protein
MILNGTKSAQPQVPASAPTSDAARPSPALPGTALQSRIDAATGGTVVLPVGRYCLSDSLRLRSNCRVIADGEVVLTRPPIVESPLINIIGYGHAEFRPADPSLFDVGMGVAVTDSRGGGFGTTVARIVGRDGGTFFLDTPAQRDYRPDDGARVRTIFPLIAGYGIEQADVEGVTLDGTTADSSLLDGCRDAGVYLLRCRDVRLKNVEVRNYPGDAVSFQQCIDIYVRDCELHHNAGHGLHPGSGSVRYVMRHNHVHHNGGCGIFYCLRTTHSLCQDNQIEFNQAEGISIGERDSDHLIEGNTLRSNGTAGIRFRRAAASGGDRVIVHSNQLMDNGRLDSAPQLDVQAGNHDLAIAGNQFGQGAAPRVRIDRGCQRVEVRENRFDDRPPVPGDIDADAGVFAARPEPALRPGPAELDAGGARHLGVGALGRWVDRCLDGPAQE